MQMHVAPHSPLAEGICFANENAPAIINMNTVLMIKETKIAWSEKTRSVEKTCEHETRAGHASDTFG